MNVDLSWRSTVAICIVCLLGGALAFRLRGDSTEVEAETLPVYDAPAVPPGTPPVAADSEELLPGFHAWLEQRNPDVFASPSPEERQSTSHPATPADPLWLRLEETVRGFNRSNDSKWFALLEDAFKEIRETRGAHAERAEPLLSTAYEAVSLGVGTSDAQFERHIAKLRKWSEAYPESPIPLVAAANTYNSWAWFARGSGFASGVEEDAWKPFRERLVRARALLKKAETLQPVDPQLYVVSLRAGRVDGSERELFDDWLAKGQALDPQCLPLFREMTVSLLPRWHGEPGEVEQFAKRLQSEIPGEDGWNAFAAVAIQHARFEPAALVYGGYDLADLHTAAQSAADRWPQSSTMNQFAGFIALLSQDVPLAQQTESVIGEDFKSPWWYSSKIDAFKKLCARGKPRQSGDWDLWDLSATIGVRFLKDGDQLASLTADADALKLWEVESERPSGLVPLGFESVHSFDRHPTLNEFAIGAEAGGVNSAVLVNLEGTGEAKPLYEAGLGPFGVRYAADGQTLVAAHGHTLTVWDVPQAKKLEQTEHRVFNRVAVSPDGNRILAMRGDYYDRAEKKWHSLAEAASRFRFVMLAGFLDNDTVLGSAFGNQREHIQIYNVRTNVSELILQIPLESQARTFCLSADKKLLAVSHDWEPDKGLVGVFDLQTKQIRNVYYPVGMVYDMDFSPDGGRLALACDDGCMRVFLVAPAESSQIPR